MGLIAALFFIGFMLGSLIFPRMADIYGRRPLVLWSFIIQVISDLLMLYARSLPVLYSGLFLLGLRFSPGFQVPYVLLL